jgi:hypothetical protein
MVQRRGGARLLFESPEPGGGRDIGRQDLDGDGAIQTTVASPVNLALRRRSRTSA